MNKEWQEDLSVKATDFTEENRLFTPQDRLVVGVSGGADSMALLHWLCSFMPIENLVAVHINHGIRGEEADRDEDFVRDRCAAWGVHFVGVRKDIPALAQERKMGLEETGRSERYATFKEVARQVHATRIVTAHTASDQAETVLMHLARGCGLSGLTGIPCTIGEVVRPLLTCSRETVETYCRAYAIPYVQDSTNEDTRYTRNAIRHRVLPALKEINPSVENALCRLAQTVSADETYLSRKAQEELANCRLGENRYARAVMRQEPDGILYRMIRHISQEHGFYSLERNHFLALKEAIYQGNGAISLSALQRFEVTDEAVLFIEEEQPADCSAKTVAVPSDFSFGGKKYTLRILEGQDTEEFKNVHKLFFKFAVDYDKIHFGKSGMLTARSRHNGESLSPAGRKCTKTLKSLLQEAGVDARQRDAVLLLCDEDGVVLIPGICCTQRVRTDETTKRFLVCTPADLT